MPTLLDHTGIFWQYPQVRRVICQNFGNRTAPAAPLDYIKRFTDLAQANNALLVIDDEARNFHNPGAYPEDPDWALNFQGTDADWAYLATLHTQVDRVRMLTKGRTQVGYYETGIPITGFAPTWGKIYGDQYELQTDVYRGINRAVDFVACGMYWGDHSTEPSTLAALDLCDRTRREYGKPVILFVSPLNVDSEVPLDDGRFGWILDAIVRAGHLCCVWGNGTADPIHGGILDHKGSWVGVVKRKFNL